MYIAHKQGANWMHSSINSFLLLLIYNILSKVKYGKILVILFTFILCFDITFAVLYRSPISLGVMASIIETTWVESYSMLKGFWHIALFSLFLLLLFIFKSQKELKESILNKKKSFLIFITTSCLLFTYLYQTDIKGNEIERYNLKTLPLLTVQKSIYRRLPLFFNDLIVYLCYRQEMRAMEKFIHAEKEIPDFLSFNEANDQPEKIFLIIGESSLRGSYSLYGYSLPTTPSLDSLSKLNNIEFTYYDAIAVAPLTREAIRLSLSFATPNYAMPFFTQKNIIDLANEVGYETIWISNQDKLGIYDNNIGYIASCAYDSYFLDSKSRDDLELIKILESKLVKGKKQFIVLHMYGSHSWYGDRNDDIDKTALTNEINNDPTVLEYDRSIHHTDRFLKKVTDLMFQTDDKSILYYYSDHGEIVGKGHALYQKGGDQYEVPLIIINKDCNIQTDSIVKKYITPSLNAINTGNSIFILSEFLGYDVLENRVKDAIKEGEYIYDVDGSAYLYETMPRHN